MAFTLNPFQPGLDVVRNRPLWGSFWDTTIQTPTQINTPQPININTTDPNSQGISIVSGSQLTFSRDGIYTITYSVQLTNAATQIKDVNVWLRKNDSGSSGDIADSNSRYSVDESHGGVSGHTIGTVNYIYKLQANDYIQFMWSSPDLLTNISTIPASAVAPVHPLTPGIIVTVVQIA